MLAPLLAAALSLAALAGPGRAARPRDDNAARAQRGLLPRKVRRPGPASGARRIVVVPAAATWLGEPGSLPEPIPAAARAGEVPAGPARPASVVAAVSGVEVDVTLVLADP